MKTATYLPQLLTVAVLAILAVVKPDQVPLDLQSITTALKWQKFASQTPVQTVKQQTLTASVESK